MSFSYPESFLDEMQAEGRVASDSGPVTVGDVAEEQRSGRKKPEQKEAAIQKELFEMAAWKEGERPALALLHAVPNGQYRRGQRPEPGLKSGVPDVCLPAPRWCGPRLYHGLYLELKREGGRVRDAQRWWFRRLRDAGYAARVAYSYEAAWTIIIDYLDGCLLPPDSYDK